MNEKIPNNSSHLNQNKLPQIKNSEPSHINNLYVKDTSTQSGDDLVLESWEKDELFNKKNTSIISRIVLFQCDQSKDIRAVIASDSQKYASKILCTCGSIHRILLDSRHNNRKPVQLHGFYVFQNDDAKFGKIVVEDLSFSGLKFRMTHLKTINRGDLLYIQFILDDEEQTLIWEKVRVSHVSHDTVGAEFINVSKPNPKLALYLMH